MSKLLSVANGNLSSSSTFAVVDPTSLLDAETAGTLTTTSFVSSQIFVPGAITISGICVKVSNVAVSLLGTFSARLFNSTAAAAVAGTTVTVNVSDLPNQTSAVGGTWVYLKFSSPITLLAATNYTLQTTSSSASTVTLYRDATAANWSRMLVTTTTQAPVAADNLVVIGSMTAAATHTTCTITVDTTIATVFGQIDVNTWGTLQYPSANAGLALAGILYVRCGAFTIQSVSSPLSSTFTNKLQFVSTSTPQYGLISNVPNLATGPQTSITMGGAVKTRTAKLSASSIVGASSLSTVGSTNWKTGDNLAIAPAGRTFSQMDSFALPSDASGSVLSVPAMTYAHAAGNDIVNTTSNVQVFGASNLLTGYIYVAGNVSFVADNVEFYWLGSNTASKRGIDLAATNTNFVTNCSMHDYINFTSAPANLGIGANVQAAATNFKVNGNVAFNNPYLVVVPGNTAGTTLAQVENNVCIGGLQNSPVQCSSSRTTFTGNTSAGCISIGMTISDDQLLPYGDFSGNTTYGNASSGMNLTLTNRIGSLCQNQLSYLNNGTGISATLTDSAVLTPTCYGNNGSGLTFGASSNGIIQGATIYSTSAFAQAQGIVTSTFVYGCYIDSCTIGGTSPLNHSTGDISFAGVTHTDLVARNTTLASPNKVVGAASLSFGSYFGQAAIAGVAGAHSFIRRYGVMVPDTVIFLNSPRSVRMTPNSAAFKFQMPNQTFAIANGQSANISVSVRTSVVGDGAAYNGNAPRLMLRANPATGVTSDTVLATFSGSAGNWTALAGVTPVMTDDSGAQVYIDCDGTTGWVNVQNWVVS